MRTKHSMTVTHEPFSYRRRAAGPDPKLGWPRARKCYRKIFADF
jgi:hypothetical protein